MHSEEFINKMKSRLLQEKASLEEEIKKTKVRPEFDTASSDDVAEELEAEDIKQDLLGQLEDDLRGIDDALSRIANGSYGKCAVGGEDIPEPRLEAVPWATTCIEHEA